MLCRLPYDAGGGLPEVSEGSGGASLAGAFATGVLEIIDILYPDEGPIVSASSAPPGPTLNGLWGGSPTSDAAFASGLFGVTKSTVGAAFAPGLALGDVGSPDFAFGGVLGGAAGLLSGLQHRHMDLLFPTNALGNLPGKDVTS